MNGAVGELLSPNGYAYANGNPVNLVDPSGNYAVDVWTSAFIEPATITFPYIGDGSVDPNAIWHGDNRSFYTGGQSSRPSARVWHEVDFSTSNPAAYTTNQDTGPSAVRYIDYNGWVAELLGKAPSPTPATVQILGPLVHVVARAFSENPLFSGAPPIVYEYAFSFNLLIGEVWIQGTHSAFPWHEALIQIDNGWIFSYQYSPSGLTRTPLDLFGGGQLHFESRIRDSRLSQSC